MHARILMLAAAALVMACGGKNGGNDTDADAGSDAPDVAAEDVAPDEPSDAEDAEADAPPAGPGAEFDRFCTGPWDADLVEARVNELGGAYSGVYDDFPIGTRDMMKVIPEHPFHVRTVRAAFAAGSGRARIRLMDTLANSAPGETDLVAPAEIDVDTAHPDVWHEIDVSADEVYLLPTHHYAIVYEHIEDTRPIAPLLAVEELLEGESSRGLIFVSSTTAPYGMAGNFRMQLVGDYFCSWDASDRWFREDDAQPWVETIASGRAGFADVDGDGHEDLVCNAPGPIVFLADGTGAFASPSYEPFPDTPRATMLVFGDFDNDGDEDAFAASNVSPNADGDRATKQEGDCNDAVDTIYPGRSEIAGNGIDDDCDTVADDGTDTSDADSDTVTIAAGDCDDTRATVHPGAPELLDSIDNDCDGQTDEDFVNRILLNDGTGVLTIVPSSGVEALNPTAAGGVGDGNGDGFLDIYWGNWLEHYPDPLAVPDVYAVGAGDGTFTDSTGAALMALTEARACYGVKWTDYNNDGLQDVWVGNYGYGLNMLFTNSGDGTFTDPALELGVARDDVGTTGGNTYGADFGDIDNDGDMDLYEPTIAHPRTQPWSDPGRLLVNEGPPTFAFTTYREERGFIFDEGEISAAFADFDNDMDLDLAIGSTYPTHYSRLFMNDGAGNFTDVTYETGTAVMMGANVAWADVDTDGDLDLVIADGYGPNYLNLFLNLVGQDQGYVQLLLRGTTTNRDAIGARVTLTAGGVTQIRDVAGSGGHNNNQSTRIVHFGLGSASTIDSVTVHWVGGATETITGVSPNGRYLVVEGTGTATPIP